MEKNRNREEGPAEVGVPGLRVQVRSDPSSPGNAELHEGRPRRGPALWTGEAAAWCTLRSQSVEPVGAQAAPGRAERVLSLLYLIIIINNFMSTDEMSRGQFFVALM